MYLLREPFEPDRPGGAVDAGHYLSRAVIQSAFVEMNINAQRKSCNRPGGDRRQVQARNDRAVWPGSRRGAGTDTTPRRYRAEDYRRIRDEYRAKLKALNNEER